MRDLLTYLVGITLTAAITWNVVGLLVHTP